MDEGPDYGHFHYGLFHAVPAMYQLGGKHWEQFFPTTVSTLLRHQGPRGNWMPEHTAENPQQFGDVYTTALVVTALNTPNQLLPIFQK